MYLAPDLSPVNKDFTTIVELQQTGLSLKIFSPVSYNVLSAKNIVHELYLQSLSVDGVDGAHPG